MNGVPVMAEEDITKGVKLKWFLKTHQQPVDKYKHYDINPKYLYSDQFFDKIKKLRDVFIEFDGDGSSIIFHYLTIILN